VVTDQLLGVNGKDLEHPVTANFHRVAAVKPHIERVALLTVGGPAAHYFHGDGSETARLLGANFGADAANLRLWVGETAVDDASLLLTSDGELEFSMPDLMLGTQSASLPLKIERTDLGTDYIKYGAVTILPQFEIDDINPHTGPPRGGNSVHLYGRGFSHRNLVRFAGALAGDLRVYSSSHIEVKAPAGSFGEAAVTMESELFPGEATTSPQSYFYSGSSTGSVALPTDASSPVAAMAKGEQLIYLVTGGHYEVVNEQGVTTNSLRSSTARLIIADVSDPVHPVTLSKLFANGEEPYHFNVSGGLPPSGFTDIAVEDRNLYLVGGKQLYHFDVTLPTDPLLLSSQRLLSDVSAIAVKDGLLYLATASGIELYRVDNEQRLTHLGKLTTTDLQGAPGRLYIDGRSLWVTLPEQQQVVEIELASGTYGVVRRVVTQDAVNNRFTPVDLLAVRDKLLVSTGKTGSVQLFHLDAEQSAVAVTDLKLTYLIPGGDLFAGRMLLSGSTLILASGQGDVQLFDISAWLDNRVADGAPLKNYFAVTGNVNDVAFTPAAIYAGTSFIYADGERIENPVSDGLEQLFLSGGLDTIANSDLIITDQLPNPGGTLAADSDLSISFNRVLDYAQIESSGSSLMEVTLDGVPVSGHVSQLVTGEGTRLIFRPVAAYEDAKEYKVTLAAEISDLHGYQLGEVYSFRFIASDQLTPVIDSLSPLSGSWRGGTEITLDGSGFDSSTEIEIGGVQVAESDILARHVNQLTFRLPGLAASPLNNRLVGVALRNGPIETFRAGRFTYVADPTLQAIGKYDQSRELFTPGLKTFLFNAGERFAIQGAGLSEHTRVRVNGNEASDVQVVRSDLISVAVPDNTLGSLNVEISNSDFGADSAFDESLTVELDFSRQLQLVDLKTRSGDLLATAYENEARLYSVRDSVVPLYLSKMEALGEISELALSAEYAALLSGDRGDLEIFDITNLYAPTRVNLIQNLRALNYRDLQLEGGNLYLLDDSRLYYGHASSGELASMELVAGTGPAFVAMLAQPTALYLLFEDRLEARDLDDPSLLLATYYHATADVDALRPAGGRLAITAGSRMLLVSVNRLLANGGEPLIGLLDLQDTPAREAAVYGELLLRKTTQGRVEVYDLELAAERSIELKHLANLRYDQFSQANPASFIFHGDLLGWINSSSYYNASIPLNNAAELSPLKLSTAGDTLALQLQGNLDSWQQARLGVRALSDDSSIAGSNQVEGHRLAFTPTSDSYALGDLYRIELTQQPGLSVDGAGVNLDLPYYLGTEAIFGLAPFTLSSLSPTIVAAGSPVSFELRGQQLGQITELQIGNLILGTDQFTLDASGQTLGFNASLNEVGVHSLQARQTAQRELLPAALSVVEPLSISSVASDNTAGSNRVSDTGGDQVSVLASGLSNGVSLHWYPTGQGILPSQGNRLDYQLFDDRLVFTTPSAMAGLTYQITLLRSATAEQVEASADQLLLSIDDTAPNIMSVQRLGYTEALILQGAEPIRATSPVSFSVSKTFKDYETRSQQTIDVSDRFDPLLSQGDNLILRLKIGATLDHNAVYTIRIDGLQDLQGNPALDNDLVKAGVYSETFVADDLLAPAYDSISLRFSSGGEVTPATQFKRGNSYTLQLSAIDNYVDSDHIKFKYRLSSDGGLSYRTAWVDVKGREFQIDVDGTFSSLQLLVRASDGSNSIERVFNAAVSDPAIDLGSPGFATDPASVEELERADLIFDLTGDVELIKSAQIKVLDQTWIPAPFDLTSRQVRLSYLNPKLSELQPDDPLITQYEVPVALRVGYGFTGQESYLRFDRSYQLLGDSTPPSLDIVAPADGEFVPRGKQVEVILSSFDRYGVDYVELCLNSSASPDPFTDTTACQQLSNPNRFSFALAADETADQQIVARAVDLNGLQSAPVSITLHPYDGQEGAPQLSLLSPANGIQAHGNELLPVQLRMRHLTAAELQILIAADPLHVDNPSPISVSRLAEDSEVLDLTVSLPDVAANTVVLLKAEADFDGQTLTSERYINLVADHGIDQAVELELVPSSQVLTGSELWIRSQQPAEMDDFSSDSFIAVYDPELASPDFFSMNGERHAVTVSIDGSAVKVDAHLRDRSGHESLRSELVSKLSYLQGGRSVEYSSAEPEYELLGLSLMTGATDELVWAENHRQAGYRIRNLSQLIDQQTSGAVRSLDFSGSGLVIQLERDGEQWLRFLPYTSAGFGSALETRLFGEVVGASGDLIFLRHGKLFSALRYQSGQLLPMAGVSLSGKVHDIAQYAQRLAVLTDTGVSLIEAGSDAVPGLKVSGEIPIADQQGLTLQGDQLLSWDATGLVQLNQLNWSSGLSASPLATFATGGQIDEAIWDGEIVWLSVSDTSGAAYWQQWRDAERVGALPRQEDEILFAAGSLYRLTNLAGSAVIESENLLVASGASVTGVETRRLPFGLLVSIAGGEGALGRHEVFFTDTGGQRLPAWSIDYRGELDTYLGSALAQGETWFLPASAMQADMQLHLRDHSADIEYTQSITADTSTSGLPGTVAPAAAASVVTGSQLPLTLDFAAGTQPNTTSVDYLGGSIAAITTLDGRAYHWLPVEADATAIDTQLHYGSSPQAHALTPAANSQNASVLLTGVVNNQLFAEGDQLDFSYQVNLDTGHQFNYIQLQLMDFNGNSLLSLPLAAAQGEVSLRLPAVAVQESFRLSLTAYLDSDYRYTETQVGIRVAPRLDLPQLVLNGLPSHIEDGSLLNLSLSGYDDSRYQGSIQLFDGVGGLLFSGGESLSISLPSGLNQISVTAQVSDGYGNTVEQSYEASVTHTTTLSIDELETLPFDHFAADVDGYWYSRGRELFNQAGLFYTAEGEIKAIARLDRQLLIAVEGFGLYMLDPVTGDLLATKPWAPSVEHLSAGEEGIALAYGARVELFSLIGSELSHLKQLDMPTPVLQLRGYGSGYLVLTENELRLIDGAGNTLHSHAGSGFTAMAVSGQRLFVARNDGSLLQLNERLQGEAHSLDLTAEKLITLDGRLLALSSDMALVQLVDIAADSSLQVVARWQLPLQGNLAEADLAGGKVRLGGAAGQILLIDSGAEEFVTLYDSETSGDGVSGQIRDLAFQGGRLVVAADNFGALILTQQGTQGWSGESYPTQAYTRATSAVAAGSEHYFVLQPQAQQVYALDRTDLTAQLVFDGLQAADITLTESELVLSAGGDLHLARLDNYAEQRSIQVSSEALVQIASSGALVSALSDSGRTLLVDTREARPLNQQVTDLSSQLGLDILDVSLNGDLLFARSDTQLQRLQLHNLSTDTVSLAGAPVLVSLQRGRLWVVTEETGAFVLQALDPYSLAQLGSLRLTLPAAPTALAVEHDRIAIGYGSQRLQVLRLPQQLSIGDRATVTPAAHLSYQADDSIAAYLHDQGVASVAYLINGEQVATQTQAPFMRSLAIPSHLLNGHGFELSTRVEMQTGQVVDSLPRPLFLQSENSVANAFDLLLQFDEHSWLPVPLTLSAQVVGSSQPIAEVSFLMSATTAGPWEQIGQATTPPHQVTLNIGTEYSGYSIKARAVDVFGNRVETAPQTV
jgi:hypothetical protein